MFDQEARDHDVPSLTVRPAEPSDAGALAEIAELDGRHLGQAPHLVAESDETIVAALSLVDGAVIAHPFRFTVEAVAMLRSGAAEHGGIGSTPACRSLRRAPILPALLIAVVVSVLAIGAASGQAAAKPGLPTGTWIGTGIASGSDSQSGITSRFTAKLRFRIVVAGNGRVTGTGSFSSAIVVSGEFPSAIASKAAVAFGGTPTNVSYTGTARSTGRFGTVTRTLKPIRIAQLLPISRAGDCRATGSVVLNGVALRWSAVRTIAGTCRT